jgi:hypothetical protein
MRKYIVKKGDFLGKIAKQNATSVERLLKINPQIKDPDKIFIGQKINIDSGTIPPPPPPPNVDIEKLIKAYFGLQIAINDAGIAIPKSKTDVWSKKFNETTEDLINAVRSQDEMTQKSLRKEISTRMGQVEEILNRTGGKDGGESKISSYGRAREDDDDGKIDDIVSSLPGNINQNDLDYFLSAMKVASKFTDATFAGDVPNTTNENKEKNTMNKIFESYFKQNLKENYDEEGQKQLASAMARVRKTGDTDREAIVDIQDVEEQDLQQLKDKYLKDKMFRKAVDNRLSNFITGVDKIVTIDPEIDFMKDLKSNYTQQVRGINEEERYTGEVPEPPMYRVSYIRKPESAIGLTHVKVVHNDTKKEVLEPIIDGNKEEAKRKAEEKLANILSKDLKQTKSAMNTPRVSSQVKENFENTPFGQIVADEVNKVVNNLPEIKFASSILSEQETQELGREVAVSVLNQVRNKMVEDLPGMVEEILQNVLSEMDS